MEPPPIPLRAPLDPALVGTWRSEVGGTDLVELGNVEPQFVREIALFDDGTADLRWPPREWASLTYKDVPPFPITWETSSEGMLTIDLPIAPMPEYEIMDWIQEAVRYDVLSVTSETLTLSDRRHDGELITDFRRQGG